MKIWQVDMLGDDGANWATYTMAAGTAEQAMGKALKAALKDGQQRAQVSALKLVAETDC